MPIKVKINKLFPEKIDFWLWLVFATDLLVIVFHLFHVLPVFDKLSTFQDIFFYLATPNSLAEIWQFFQEFWIVIILILLTIKSSKSFMPWIALYGYLMLDDFFELHEALSRQLIHIFNIPQILNLEAKDIGELIIYGLMGIIFLAPLIIAYFRLNHPLIKKDYKKLFMLTACLAFLGVVLDLGTHLIYRLTGSNLLANLLALLEDGGELLIISLILWQVNKLIKRQTTALPI